MKKTNFRNALLQVMFAIAIAVLLPMTVSAKVTYEKEQVLYMSSKSHYMSSYATLNVSCTKSSEKIKKSSVKISKATVAEMVAIVRGQQKSQTEFFSNYGQDQVQTRYDYQLNLRLLNPGKTKLSFKVGEKKHTITLNVKAYTNPIKKLTITGVSGGKNLASKFDYANYCPDLNVPAKVNKATINVTANRNWKIVGIVFADAQNSESYAYQNSGVMTKAKGKLSVGTLRPGRVYECSVMLRHKNGGIISCAMRVQ